MEIKPLSAKEFNQFKSFIYSKAGISLSDAKQPLVTSRLSKRLKHHDLSSFTAYFNFIQEPNHLDEQQVAINLLTTNETHFFREPKHFDYFKDKILPLRVKGRPFRVWSAASSSGEEVYTIAMLLSEYMSNEEWEIIGSDISTAVLEKARLGCYSIERMNEIPRNYLTKYCLKGVGKAQNTILMSKELRQRVKFMPINLTQSYPNLGQFDVIFLRNVMIYFDNVTKQNILKKMSPCLKNDGYFFISHSESLNGVSDDWLAVAPSVYKKNSDAKA